MGKTYDELQTKDTSGSMQLLVSFLGKLSLSQTNFFIIKAK
jgi:hypothetical protein